MKNGATCSECFKRVLNGRYVGGLFYCTMCAIRVAVEKAKQPKLTLDEQLKKIYADMRGAKR